jgi:lycopene cyclase domain-containing protein
MRSRLMNLHLTYFIILSISLAGPLALSFDKKVAFYKKWKYLFLAMVFPVLFYILWDIWFTSLGVWYFNEKYILGIKIGNLPIEEILFFFLVPYCCVFIYECVRCYFPNLKNKKEADWFLKMLSIVLLIIGIIFFNRYYTFWTFIFTSLFIFVVYIFRKYFRTFDALSFLVSYLIILIPFLVVNGILTRIPVVIYNNAENMGIRLFTIPVEDIIYGMLLTLLIVCLYERILLRKD